MIKTYMGNVELNGYPQVLHNDIVDILRKYKHDVCKDNVSFYSELARMSAEVSDERRKYAAHT